MGPALGLKRAKYRLVKGSAVVVENQRERMLQSGRKNNTVWPRATRLSPGGTRHQ